MWEYRKMALVTLFVVCLVFISALAVLGFQGCASLQAVNDPSTTPAQKQSAYCHDVQYALGVAQASVSGGIPPGPKFDYWEGCILAGIAYIATYCAGPPQACMPPPGQYVLPDRN